MARGQRERKKAIGIHHILLGPQLLGSERKVFPSIRVLGSRWLLLPQLSLRLSLREWRKKGGGIPTHFCVRRSLPLSQSEHQKTSEAFSTLIHTSGWSCIKFRLEETSGEQNALSLILQIVVFLPNLLATVYFAESSISRSCSYIHSERQVGI